MGNPAYSLLMLNQAIWKHILITENGWQKSTEVPKLLQESTTKDVLNNDHPHYVAIVNFSKYWKLHRF